MKSSEFTNHSIEAVIRLGLLLLLATWCFRIVTPFFQPIIWGVIIAVAIYPLFLMLKARLGDRNKLAATVYTLLALTFLITPTVMVANSVIDTTGGLAKKHEQGLLEVPPPKVSVKEWPLIGESVYTLWDQAADNLEDTLKKYKEETTKVVKFFLALAAGAAASIIKFIIAIIISGVLVANASAAYELTIKIFSRLTNVEIGKTYADLSKDTIRSVAQGVLGVALIQATFSALGMVVMDVPGWGLWTLFVLVVAIAQLPPLVVLSFVCAYVFSVAETTPAVIFLIYCVVVSSSDAFLKPLFLGRGMSTPMLIILLGAIGGMILSGIIGLFIGAIILALGYELFVEWLNRTEVSSESNT